MGARNFFLLGRTDRNAIVARLREVLTRWQDEWCIEVSAPDVDIISENLREAPLPACVWRSGTLTSETKAAVGFATKASDGLMSALIDSSLLSKGRDMAPAEIEAELTGSAVEALIAILLEGFDAGKPSIKWDSKKLESETLDPHKGFIVVRCRTPAVEMFIVLYPGLTERYVQRGSNETGRHRPQVTPVRNVFAAQRLTMWICAGVAELALMELHNLSVGDVIILDRRLNEPLTIHIAGSVDCATGHLGFKAGRKAVQLAIPNDNEGVES